MRFIFKVCLYLFFIQDKDHIDTDTSDLSPASSPAPFPGPSSAEDKREENASSTETVALETNDAD